MIPELIKLFNCVAVKAGERLYDAEVVNRYAARCGYLVLPEACTDDALRFFENEAANYNTTFYKSWKDVETLDEADMRILQLVHYLSTYGTNFEGKTFTMNDFPEEMRFADFKVIVPCTERELFDRILSMLESGMALNAKTLELVFTQANRYAKDYGWTIDPAAIKNREARALYYIDRGILPYDPFELMRIIMYTSRGDAMIINDERTFSGITSHIRDIAALIVKLDERHMELLAEVFYRYKRIMLFARSAMRTVLPGNEAIPKINKIRRLARKFHKPLKPGVLQTILAPDHSLEDIAQAVDSVESPFVIIRLLNYLRGMASDSRLRAFFIRNGSAFVKGGAEREVDLGRIEAVRQLLAERMRQLMTDKASKPDGTPKTVKLPSKIELAAPVSEKLFVGKLPYGSSLHLDNGSYVGIYWRNEWGTRDFDLWVVYSDGERIGWAENHKNDDILFSGDMTNADPEATEIVYCRREWPDSTVRVCRFSGMQDSKFRLFAGADSIADLPTNYMVNPDTIAFEDEIISDKREMMVGFVRNSRLFFASVNISEAFIPANLRESGVDIEEALAMLMASYTPLSEILAAAGFRLCDESDLHPDIDLSKALSKDSLIALFA